MTNKDNAVISNKKAIVACDLFLSLRLYHLPKWLQGRLKVAFPNVEIVPVNTPDSPLTTEDATVYWGNRITSEIIKNMLDTQLETELIPIIRIAERITSLLDVAAPTMTPSTSSQANMTIVKWRGSSR